MSRFPRLARYAAVGALAVSTLSVFAASPAGAAATGSLAAATNGVAVTWSSTAPDYVLAVVFAAGHTCSSNDSDITPGAIYTLSSAALTPSYRALSASPTTMTFGSTVGAIVSGNPPTSGTIAAGSYVFCLIGKTNLTFSVLGQQAATIVDPSATTTTTAAPTTTTTAGSGATSTTAAASTATTAAGAAADPVAPAFTG